MKTQLTEPDIAAITAQGARENNEDSYRAEQTEEALLLLVADGLGGYEGGEKASAVVADVCASCFHAFPKGSLLFFYNFN